MIAALLGWLCFRSGEAATAAVDFVFFALSLFGLTSCEVENAPGCAHWAQINFRVCVHLGVGCTQDRGWIWRLDCPGPWAELFGAGGLRTASGSAVGLGRVAWGAGAQLLHSAASCCAARLCCPGGPQKQERLLLEHYYTSDGFHSGLRW